MHRLIIFNIALFCILSQDFLLAQNAQETFGKNKVQYNDDQQEWWIYESSNIVYYWYGKSRKAAEFYISIAEAENKKIREIFEFHLRDKIELVIYSDLSDLQQTNLDLDHYFTPENWKEDPRVVGQKILLCFNGNHQDALRQLRNGLIRIYFSSIFSGSQLEEAVQKVISLRLPDWYEKGLVSYLGETWNDRDLYEMKFLLKKKLRKTNGFRKFYDVNASLAGKSMWNFIVQTYGQQAISNWLYMTRIQKDVNQAAKLVFQRNLRSLYADWSEYYAQELKSFRTPSAKYPGLRLRKEEEIRDAVYSGLFGTTVLCTNQNGRKRIRLLEKNGRSSRIIYRSGYRNKISLPEKHYPLYAESGKRYAILDQRGNRNYLSIYSADHRLIDRNVLPEDIMEVYDFILSGEKKIIFTGTNNGLSDVFEYDTKGRSYKKLTDDIYDDLLLAENRAWRKNDDIKVIRSQPDKAVLTAKLDSVVPVFPFKIYSLRTQDGSLSGTYECIGNGSVLDYAENPTARFFKCDRKSEDLFYEEKAEERNNLSEPFLHKIIASGENNMLLLFRKPDGRYFTRPGMTDSAQGERKIMVQIPGTDSAGLKETRDSLQTILGNLFKFESPFGDPENSEDIIREFYIKSKPFRISDLKSTEQQYEGSPRLTLNPSQAIAYRYRFSMDDWSTTFNNDILFGGLNTYTGFNPAYQLPRPGILFKTKLQEVFQNYTIEFGIRIPTSFIGSEAFLLLNNFKYRWDHSLGFYRRADRTNLPYRQSQDLSQVNKTFLVNYVLKYPLDPYRSFRINSTVRNDHSYIRNTERFVLDSAGQNIQSAGTRLEFVHDDALQLGVNLRQGLQLKAFFEMNKRFSSSLDNGLRFDALPGWMLIAGLDARYHVPVMKHSVFSNRLFINSSFGTQKLLNQLGGTQNWLLFAKYNNELPSDLNGPYSFTQLATEIRGHAIGERKGSSVMLFTSEIRIPFFQYLLSQNWRNSFLRNLQFMGFLDAGLTWNGFLPKASDVEKYRYSGSNPAVKVNVIYTRNPFIAGTGIGLRTSLFGYFVRFDYGWPIVELKPGKPLLHVSLGLDF